MIAHISFAPVAPTGGRIRLPRCLLRLRGKMLRGTGQHEKFPLDAAAYFYFRRGIFDGGGDDIMRVMKAFTSRRWLRRWPLPAGLRSAVAADIAMRNTASYMAKLSTAFLMWLLRFRGFDHGSAGFYYFGAGKMPFRRRNS